MDANTASPTRERVRNVVIRFAGDSGDGMQLMGSLFTNTSAIAGNDLATFPDFPAEIRAPAGTLPGVSGFQLNFSSFDIHTPGDQPDVLVAMNPAALKANIRDLKPNGIIVVNTDSFAKPNLKKAGYESNPLDDHSLDGYRVFGVDLTSLTKEALKDSPLGNKEKDRCKNFFALGLMYWLFGRELDHTYKWIERKFAKTPELSDANKTVLKAGWAYGQAAELFHEAYDVPPAKLPPGKYRNISGNQAIALGLIAAGRLADRRLVYGSYPITPASDVLHYLSREKHYNVYTFQAEDEIAAVGASVGAAFAGHLGVTATSGPGNLLKAEFIGLATMVELPLIICDIQRAGPSTGMPTKVEQSDLLVALFGRHGDAPIPVLAPATPGECFDYAIEAARIAIEYMIPIFVLTDGYLANGAEPWLVPDASKLQPFATRALPHPENFEGYRRDEATLGRPWVPAGTPGFEHRVGGLEKWDNSGNVSYDPANHQRMTELRAEKVARIANSIPEAVIEGDQEGDVLVIAWGSTYGAIRGAVDMLREAGHKIGHMHLRYLNPFPKNVEAALKRYKHVLVPELNMGQLRLILRAKFLVDAKGFNKIQGRPFTITEVKTCIEKLLAE